MGDHVNFGGCCNIFGRNCSKRLIFSHVFTSYLYYAICISKHEYERLSKLLCITKWLSKLPHVGSAALLQTADTPCDLGTCLFSPLP